MPDLDLGPHDYRAEPVKGERVFVRGGLVKLLVFALAIAFGIAVAVVVQVVTGPVVYPMAEWFACSITGTCS